MFFQNNPGRVLSGSAVPDLEREHTSETHPVRSAGGFKAQKPKDAKTEAIG